MRITKPFYDFGGRKYIDVDNIRLKVPWRYNRVHSVEIKGTTLPVQMLEANTLVTHISFETKHWNGESFKILKSLSVEKNGD